MGDLRVAASALAQRAWLSVRGAARAVVGEDRLGRFLDASGLRALKYRFSLSRRELPDGGTILYRPHDACIVEEVYDRGVYSGETIGSGATVVDVGAHIGAFSLLAGRRVGPKGRVLAFEPSPKTYALLERNLRANGLPWIKARPVAIADADAEVDLYVADDPGNNPSADTLTSRPGRRAVRVRTLRLDDVLAEENVERVDVLKIDAEGAELRVLDGAAKTLARTRRLVMEVHPPAVDPAEVRRRLEALGFSCRTVLDSEHSVILDAARA